jgi:hypothetical protein
MILCRNVRSAKQRYDGTTGEFLYLLLLNIGGKAFPYAHE